MSREKQTTAASLGRDWAPSGTDERAFRDALAGRAGHHRLLERAEIDALERNGNRSDSWDRVLVLPPFDPAVVRNCEFYGLVRIGRLAPGVLERDGLSVPVGLTASRIAACDLGDGVAVHNVGHLSRCRIGDGAIVQNVGELLATGEGTFGRGAVLELGNENGRRAVAAFEGMLPADAHLAASWPDDEALQARLRELAQRREVCAVVGSGAMVRHCRTIRDAILGPHAIVRGADRLENVTISSTAEQPALIGEGADLSDGVASPGCRIVQGVKAERFALGENVSLLRGARVAHVAVGDNSTIACCEVLHSLLLPAHEQHHNNSFLIAATVLGQSNVAAGATLGSNHNSRAPDGELLAGRGFWPGLCVSVKHCCRFASYTLLAKGDYPAELDVPLPFSLLNHNAAADRLEVLPAYWWMYNLYALARNAWKYAARDRRVRKRQHIETDPLAPDTAEEIFAALALLEKWIGAAAARAAGRSVQGVSDAALAEEGRKLLSADPAAAGKLDVQADGVENSRRAVVVLKAAHAHAAYRQMLHHYAMKNLLAWMADNPRARLADMTSALAGPRQTRWVNLGGQLLPGDDADALRADFAAGRLADWSAVHARYNELWARYELDKRRHACATLCALLGVEKLSVSLWGAALDEALCLQRHVAEQVRASRAKDFENPFRRITFARDAERQAVLGELDSDPFLRQVQRDTEATAAVVAEVRSRG